KKCSVRARPAKRRSPRPRRSAIASRENENKASANKPGLKSKLIRIEDHGNFHIVCSSFPFVPLFPLFPYSPPKMYRRLSNLRRLVHQASWWSLNGSFIESSAG